MLRKLYRAVCRAEVAVASVLLCSTVVVIFISAVMRSFRKPINWATDIALLMFAWATFLGADVAYRNNATVYVDIIVDRVSQPVHRALKLFSYVLVSVFMAALVIYGVLLCLRSAARPFQGIPWLSYSFVTASMPCSCFLMLITSLRKIWYEFVKHTEVPILENRGEKPWKGGSEE